MSTQVYCGRAQCGQLLGEVGPSPAQLKEHLGPQWYIRPGWDWVFPPGVRGKPEQTAILEWVGSSRAQRELMHAAYGIESGLLATRRFDERVGVRRECSLPLVVRCPKCRSLRFVTAASLVTGSRVGLR